ncbi:hypothetical protein ES707_12858 [subsurface metagenome]
MQGEYFKLAGVDSVLRISGGAMNHWMLTA